MMKSMNQSGFDGLLPDLGSSSDISIDKYQGFIYFNSHKNSAECHNKVNVTKLTYAEESAKQRNQSINEILNKIKSDGKCRLFCSIIYIFIIMKITIKVSVFLLCGSHNYIQIVGSHLLAQNNANSINISNSIPLVLDFSISNTLHDSNILSNCLNLTSAPIEKFKVKSIHLLVLHFEPELIVTYTHRRTTRTSTILRQIHYATYQIIQTYMSIFKYLSFYQTQSFKS